MKNYFYLLFLLSSISLYGQDTIYLDENGQETLNKLEATDYYVLFRDVENPDQVLLKRFHENGQLRSEFPYSSYEEKVADGTYRTWFEDGQLRSEKNYENGKSHGSFITYWENGKKKREDHYKKDKWVEGTTWDESGNEVPYYEYEIHPQFPGGKKALAKYLQENAKKPKGVAGGKVIVGFKIAVDGKIVDVQILESTNLGLNLAAYNAVANMPAWKPGQHDGKVVKVQYALPLTFR